MIETAYSIHDFLRLRQLYRRDDEELFLFSSLIEAAAAEASQLSHHLPLENVAAFI